MAGEQNILSGMWNEMKGNAHSWWGKLTDDDLQEINGDRERLIGKLEQRYGWNRMEAERQVNQRMTDYEKQRGTGMKR